MFLRHFVKFNLKKPLIGVYQKNFYSPGGHPLSEIHEQLKDVEEVFAKYRLDLINDPVEIDKLEQAGNIPKVLADNLKEEIKHKQEATSRKNRS